MLGDNEMNSILTRDPESQNCIKHINVIYHHVYGLVEDGEISIKWISSTNILTFSFIKALHTGPFKRHQ